MQKILVMGAGAVGGCFGGMLARSGADVTFLARGAQLEAMQRSGLSVESAAVGDFVVHPTAVERLNGDWKADLIVFCVKAYDNAGAIELIAPAVGSSTAILTLQNGVGGGDQLAEAFGRDRVLLGATYVDASRGAPGVVIQAGAAEIVYGEEDGAQTQRVDDIRRAFSEAHIEARVSADILVALWSKLVFICALSGMTCITHSTFDTVMATPATRDMVRRVMCEAEEVGRIRGVKLPADIVDATMTHFQEHKDEMVSSMHADLMAGRPLELSVLNGAVSRMAREAGVATPANDFITACLTPANDAARAALA